MNNYIFLTDESYTFQPEAGDEPMEIESLQVIGTARGTDANTAYRNLLAENPHLQPSSFTRIFCYQLDKEVEGKTGHRFSTQ
jgi:hypothetical protein